ncbi:MAG TPA: LpxD N-terminal domain-containing protein, partial [Nitrososphaeraceae archaeon]|nr:LpxD N-terminal domain-containing protein [Nitrososphaeraceae archaeon]
MEFDVESILSNLGINNYKLQGDRRIVRNAASIEEATENDVTFCRYEGEEGIAFISNSNAGVILCEKSMEGLVHPKPNTQIIFLEDPKLVFSNILKTIYPNNITKKISPTAVISKTVKIGSNCYIGDYAFIGENCTIGNNTIIREKASLIQNCFIGNNCII